MEVRVVKVCPSCRKKFKANHRLKDRQKTCGEGHCRQKHRSRYQRRWRRNNRSIEREYQQKRKENSPKDYWKEYRRLHPIYVCRNRAFARLRKRLLREGLQRKLDIVQVIENPSKIVAIKEFATRHRSLVLDLKGSQQIQERLGAHADTGTSG